jgi:ribosomal-protein-alanine N-acetyltransferase
MTTIREMTEKDLEVVCRLEADHQPRPWSNELFASELATDNRRYLVAIDSNHLAGFGGVMVIGDEAHITNLLVAPDFRRKQIGSGLMTRLISHAVEAGARHLTLEVRSHNEAARRLYADLGLVPVGVRKNYYGDDDALILWAHDIDQPGYLGRAR